MKTLGVLTITLAAALFAVAISTAPKAPNVGELIGRFLPTIVVLILGLKLLEKATRKTGTPENTGAGDNADSIIGEPSVPTAAELARSENLKVHALLGIVCGIVLILFSSVTPKDTAAGLISGLSIIVVGWSAVIWGCVNFARWKGYSGWLGLLAYLLLLGVIVLVCMPNRRKRIYNKQQPSFLAESQALSVADQKPWYSFLPMWIPLGLLVAIVIGAVYFSSANLAPSVWNEVAPAGAGFRALMPGKPELVEKTEESPSGDVVTQVRSVRPLGKNEMFRIVSQKFSLDLSQAVGGPEKLLEAGRRDILAASQGQLKSERRFTVDGMSALELEVIPPKGAIVKARVYATEVGLYEISVHTSKARLGSSDVEKFFDSFQLLTDPGNIPER